MAMRVRIEIDSEVLLKNQPTVMFVLIARWR
jgi:hypothetical protein